MSRRDKGEGSISQRQDGTWTARMTLGNTPDGKRKVKAFYGKTESEVKKKLREFKKELAKNDYKEIRKTTMGELLNEWLTSRFHELQPRSYDTIESTIARYVIPYIGNLQISTITPSDIQDTINELIKNNYSYSIIKKAYNAMNASLRYAVDKEYILQNPVKNIVLPKQRERKRSDIEYFNDDEIQKIVKYATERYNTGTYVYKHGYAIPLLLNTGMRVGELYALKWSNVDFENKQIHIKESRSQILDRTVDFRRYIMTDKTTKTTSSYRTIPMNQGAEEALRYFQSLNFKSEYVMANRDNHVAAFRNTQSALAKIKKKAGINHGSVHTLRHTFATQLFKKGVDIKVISELLGHSDVSVTYNIYTHVIKEQKVKAVKALDDMYK